MAILSGAVAYRQDRMASYWDEIDAWFPKRVYQYPIGCPKGCNKTYRLVLEINASEAQANQYIELIRKKLTTTPCSDHPSTVRIDRPQTNSE